MKNRKRERSSASQQDGAGDRAGDASEGSLVAKITEHNQRRNDYSYRPRIVGAAGR